MDHSLYKIFLDIRIKKNNFIFFLFLALYSSIFFFFSNDLVGILSLVSVSIIFFCIAKNYKYLAKIIYVALFIRLLIIFLGDNFITLPESMGDTDRFEIKAWEWSQEGFYEVFKYLPYDSSTYFLSWILSYFYMFTGRSMILAQSISLLFGMSAIFLGILITNKIWNEKVCIKVGWILALYPSLILYSCLFLKESFVWFFLLVAIYGIVLLFEAKGIKPFSYIFFGFVGATLFHGGMFVGGLAFLIFLILFYFNNLIKKLAYMKISIKSLFLLSSLIILIFFIFINLEYVPKIGLLKHDYSIEEILNKMSKRNINDAAYPEWIMPKTSLELIYKMPIKLLYFLFSPFPWDVTKMAHVIGFFDGLFHIFLFILIIKNFKFIWGDQILRLIFILLILYLIVFGLGIGNFGTGLRHRAKFLIMTVILVAPFFPSFVLSLKNRIK